MATVTPATETGLMRPRPSGLIWIGVAALGMTMLFWPGLQALPGFWARPEYSHGYIIPFVVLYLFLVVLHRQERPVDSSGWLESLSPSRA